MKSILKKHGNESCRNYYTYHVLKVRLYNESQNFHPSSSTEGIF